MDHPWHNELRMRQRHTRLKAGDLVDSVGWHCPVWLPAGDGTTAEVEERADQPGPHQPCSKPDDPPGLRTPESGMNRATASAEASARIIGIQQSQG